MNYYAKIERADGSRSYMFKTENQSGETRFIGLNTNELNGNGVEQCLQKIAKEEGWKCPKIN